MKIKYARLLVDNQDQARDFYTNILGFSIHSDIPVAEQRYLSVVSPQQPEGPELLLEQCQDSNAQAYQEAMYWAGVPAASFFVTDLAAEYTRLQQAGVTFLRRPFQLGPVHTALFDDRCGNIIQLIQQPAGHPKGPATQSVTPLRPI